MTAAKPFCAVCVRTIKGAPRMEPIGKNDALVAVCEDCATVEVPEPELGNHVVVKEPRDDRAARIREHRRRLKQRGICVYGENHGPATHGELCEACRIRQRGRKKSA